MWRALVDLRGINGLDEPRKFRATDTMRESNDYDHETSTDLSTNQFPLIALAVALAGALLFAGCCTTDGGGIGVRNLDYSGHLHRH